MRFVRHLMAHVFGDCRRCGHSIIYHMPLFGCFKCDCEEFH